jgi:hypothetical protein
MLAAAQAARFAVWKVGLRHDIAGLDITDVISNEEHWLIDESLEASCPVGRMFAGRLMRVEGFVMTTGAIAPVDGLVFAEMQRSMPRWPITSEGDALRDPRFAMAVFRAAIRTGGTEGLRFIDPGKENLLEAMRAR